jgi:hypothetical protein
MRRLFLLVVAVFMPVAKAAVATDVFVEDRAASKQALRELCDHIVAEKSEFKVIFIGGYYMRTLVAAARILDEPAYLNAAVKWADLLLERQMDSGYWDTGYGTVFLADTGSALGLFMNLYPHVDDARREGYRTSVARFVESIERNSLIRPSGAFGVGFKLTDDGALGESIPEEYTISSALAGGEVFTWYGLQTVDPRHQETAFRALRWVLSTMRSDGVIPYILPLGGGDRTKMGTEKADAVLWRNMVYQVATYLGEAIIAFDRHGTWPAWKQEIRMALRPHIEFLLRTQNPDGTWGAHDSWDQKRSPGVANVLIWYHREVEADERIVQAVRRFNRVLTDPEEGRRFGLVYRGAEVTWTTKANARGNFVPNDIVTALSGRALVEMLEPGIDSEW